jgi:hypothetical protein
VDIDVLTKRSSQNHTSVHIATVLVSPTPEHHDRAHPVYLQCKRNILLSYIYALQDLGNFLKRIRDIERAVHKGRKLPRSVKRATSFATKIEQRNKLKCRGVWEARSSSRHCTARSSLRREVIVDEEGSLCYRQADAGRKKRALDDNDSQQPRKRRELWKNWPRFYPENMAVDCKKKNKAKAMRLCEKVIRLCIKFRNKAYRLTC